MWDQSGKNIPRYDPGKTRRDLMNTILLSASLTRLRRKSLNDGAYQYRGIFAQFMTMREKQILARASGIQKENSG